MLKEMMGRRGIKIRSVCSLLAIMAFCAISVLRKVWMQSRSQKWWNSDMNGFSETDFIQAFRMTRAAFRDKVNSDNNLSNFHHGQ